MKRNYRDITSRIAEKPQWYDENGTPRYGPFEPGMQSDIYAQEVVLLKIECQNCGHRFEVSVVNARARDLKLSDVVGSGSIHYGDPPNIACCASGPSMNSIPLRVLQYWKHCYPSSAEEEWWQRDPALEVEVK